MTRFFSVLIALLLSGCIQVQVRPSVNVPPAVAERLAGAARGERTATPFTPVSIVSPRNVILFICDGCGPASFTMARDYARHKGWRNALYVDSLAVGAVRTYASNSRVTDSAAGATAFSAAIKTFNGAIAVDDQRRPVATLLEAAEARGMATGLVTTTRITHATPAAFSAHVPNRAMENEIADEQMTKGIEVMFGSGLRHFVPQGTEGSRRQDDRDLLAEARARGVHVVSSLTEFRGNLRSPVLALFGMEGMAYEVDRDPTQEPSLAEMTRRALEVLGNRPEGFFLMVEAARPDHAAHENDPAGHLFDMLAYDEAIRVAMDYVRTRGETLVVGVSDHETGGMSLGRDGTYQWHPAVLERVRMSRERMLRTIVRDGQDATELLRTSGGVEDLSEEERAALATAGTDAAQLAPLISNIISRRALIGWTTSGHTGVDVPLFARGPGAELFIGNHENTAVGQIIADLLGFDLPALTRTLFAEAHAE